jgi:predicted nucleic acid-binding protein
LTANIRLVVADTGPLNYLVLTGDIELLPKLFDRVLTPQAVHNELANPEAPAMVRAWIAQAPAWLEVRPNPDIRRENLAGLATPKLDDGERAAIALALAVKADLVLMDDQDGVRAVRRQGLIVTGTLGYSISRRAAD